MSRVEDEDGENLSKDDVRSEVLHHQQRVHRVEVVDSRHVLRSQLRLRDQRRMFELNARRWERPRVDDAKIGFRLLDPFFVRSRASNFSMNYTTLKQR